MKPSLAIIVRSAITAVFFAGQAVMAQTARPTVTWLLWDFAPGTISSNGQPVNGYIYNVTRMLAEAWPEAQHTLELTTTDNALASLNRGVDACYVSAVMTPERERMYYMTQTLLVAPHSIVARSEVVDKIPKNAAGEVLAGQLFDRKDLRGIVAQNRSYSVLLDALLNSRSPSSGITKARQLPGNSNILQMLSSNRGDYTIEYAVSVLYQNSLAPDTAKTQFKILPIAGLQPIAVGIACPRTEWGRATITKADALLSKLVTRPDYFDALKRWQPLELQRFMAPHIKAFMKQRSQPSDPAKFGPP